MAQTLELGMISSTWLGTKVGLEDGIRKAKEIGFDTYDIFEDPLDIDDATRKLIKETCAEVGLPIRSLVCIAFGSVDFNPSVRRFSLDRIKAYVDQAEYFDARNVVLVLGEYYWDGEVFPFETLWDFAQEMVTDAARYAEPKGVELVIELEPFTQALVKDVDELARFVREVDHPLVKANADISHLHLSDASFDDVKKIGGMIGHIHLSDCDGQKHGDLPAGRGVTPIRDYLQAIVDTGYSGTVSIELEYSPDPEKIVEWVEEAYRETAKIMADVGARG